MSLIFLHIQCMVGVRSRPDPHLCQASITSPEPAAGRGSGQSGEPGWNNNNNSNNRMPLLSTRRQPHHNFLSSTLILVRCSPEIIWGVCCASSTMVVHTADCPGDGLWSGGGSRSYWPHFIMDITIVLDGFKKFCRRVITSK